MKYLSVKQTAEKWGISGTMVRRYCVQGRISNAIQKEDGWKIPANAKKPSGVNEPPKKMKEQSKLVKKLLRQKKKKGFHGLYDYVQINLTYSSCRMASNRLTRKQVERIFRKGKVNEMFEAVKVSDVVEAMNHCHCVDYILMHVMEPLSVKSIKQLHQLLTNGTVDVRLNRVTPGEFRTVASARKESFALDAKAINAGLKVLIEEYEQTDDKTVEDILDFHVHFERIFPFDDCNGRIGRLIMFKECLRNEVIPFILDDKRRARYLEGIRNWDEDRTIFLEAVAEAQERFAHQISQQDLLEHEMAFAPRMGENQGVT